MPMVVDSADDGRTWTQPRAIGLGRAQVPGYPLRLPDGRLLLVYGNRQFPHGAQAICSRITARPGHPASHHSGVVQLGQLLRDAPQPLMPDGSILTGYYVRIFKESENVNQDVVGQTVHWRPPMTGP